MRSHRLSRPLFLPVAAATVGVTLLDAWTAHAAADPNAVDILPILLALVIILVGAKLGGSLFEALKLPAVLGELTVGIVFGNLSLAGFTAFEALEKQPMLDVLAQIGVLFLLFEVGLESNVGSMMKVGASSLLVALLGVVAPMVLGWTTSHLFFPSHNELMHWFIGATLCATSVGITARVLTDLQRISSPEGRIIIGAAVIDDVLGLIVLAVVSGIIEAANRGEAFEAATAFVILGKAVAFLVGAVIVGGWLSRHAFGAATYLRGKGILLTLSLAFCFLLAWIAGIMGLAPIVGAFAAGLVLDEVHYRELREREPHKHDITELMHPLATFLVPVFFVLMGMRVDLSVFGDVSVLGFAAVLTLAAIVGKQACSLGVLGKGVDKLAVGLGMIPRGEVGLIFAGIGSTLMIGGERVIDAAAFSAVVIMVALTTMLTPPLLVWRLRKPAGG
uniref:Cation:proton antiporter n=1 Tax=Eiseniibacteriota bacterium TaxID=2212470 RepID=A0A832I1Q5_UNCEI